MQRLERLILMVQRINEGRLPTVQWFCEQYECSERTVLEDIRFLKENLNMAIEYDRFNNGYVNRDPKQVLPPIELTEGELFVLALGKDMLTEYSGTAFEPILEAAINKIIDRLPDRSKIELADLSSVVRFKPAGIIPLQSRKAMFDLNRACETMQIVQINYYTASTGQMSIREIEPYRILESRGAWYVVAWCRLKCGVRQFAIHRIQEYKVLSEQFAPRDIDIDGYLDEAFLLEHGDAVRSFTIKFDPLAARYVRERKWHSTQELIELDDGGCILKFEAARVDEVKRWVLGFGQAAEVLEPLELRTILRDELQNCLDMYSGSTRTASTTQGMAARSSKGSKARVAKYSEENNGPPADMPTVAE